MGGLGHPCCAVLRCAVRLGEPVASEAARTDFVSCLRAALQAQALELICRCDDISDEAVELRLLKSLLTAVTSSTLLVHGQALLLVR